MEPNEDLSILICSANIGNAEPTPESFAAWIPDDGEIISKSGASGAGASNDCVNVSANKKYHLMVVGMQEAAFSTKLKTVNVNDELGLDMSLDETEHSTGSKKKGELLTKKKSTWERKYDKVGMMLRGVTANKDHRRQTSRLSIASASKSDSLRCMNITELKSSRQYDTAKFASLFADRCPSYSLLVCNMRGEMRLWILCLKGLEDEFDEVHVDGENTGIGSVLANKGGIIATINIRSTRLSFLTCHLEAHEGVSHYINRNKNLYQIFNGSKPHPDYQMMDATIYSHHTFVCGDLNYRTRFNKESCAKVEKKGIMKRLTSKEINDTEIAADDEPDNGSGYKQAMILIGENKWSELYAGDELCMALEKKECLVGFETLPCDFSPTFKVAREQGYVYNEKRTPSYTDRILWNSNDGVKGAVTPVVYEPCPDFITSDHKPIRGAFTVQLNDNESTLHPIINGNDHQINFLVSDIKCTNLPIMDVQMTGGLADPYILFVSSPKVLTWNKKWPSTKVIYRNLNPVWDEEIHLTLNHERRIESADQLSGDMLCMVVMDYDQASGDDVCGSVTLNVMDLCSKVSFNKRDHRKTMHFQRHDGLQKTQIRRPVLRNGQECGMLECTITSAYLAPGEVKAFRKTAGKIRNAKFRNAEDRILDMLRL